MKSEHLDYLRQSIRTIPDYPKPGIQFRDITTLLRDARAFGITIEALSAPWRAGQVDKVVGIGTCSGADTDKFTRFGLTPLPGKRVKAPLIKECLANIECRVVEIIGRHNIVVLEAVAAYVSPGRREKRTVHAVGDGTFVVDGRRLDRRRQMASKLPPGV